MKIVAIRVGMCSMCSRPILDTQRHLVEWVGKEALFFHEACFNRAKAAGEGTTGEAALGVLKKGGC